MGPMTNRTFFDADQLAFAHLSGDFNPMHVDRLVARRLLFGRPVVHGVHALLWSLDEWCNAHQQPVVVEEMRVDFQRPIRVDEPVRYELRGGEQERTELVLHSQGRTAARVRIRWSYDAATRAAPALLDSGAPQKGQCMEHGEQDLEGRSGVLPLHLPRSEAEILFPRALQWLRPEFIAVLLASTRLVGMECPGLHSLYSHLSLTTSPATRQSSDPWVLGYRVESIDSRFRLATVRLDSVGLSGSLRAFVRPAPRRQIDFQVAQSTVIPGVFRGRRAWVVGGSRGLGEVAAKLLAAAGASVCITYHHGADDAERVASEIRRGGGVAEIRALDVLDLPDSLVDGEQYRGGPTDLLYFATPFITPGGSGKFSGKLFDNFSRYYVHGFVDLVNALVPHGLKRVLYPSSIYVEDPPENFAEYAAAKAAGEVACAALGKRHRDLVINRPRWPRLATDQTVSLTAVEGSGADPVPLVWAALNPEGSLPVHQRGVEIRL
jgi:acyl dehydratase